MARRSRRAGIAALAAAVAGLLAACTGEGLSPGVLKGATASDQTADKAGFNPFSSEPETAGGGREVIQNPTPAEVMQAGPLGEMSFGRKDAPVTIIKYASLTCPHCRRFHLETYPQLKREYIDTGKVRFIIREFPIGKSSGTATVALRCAPPDKYLDLYGRYLGQQGAWVSQEVRTAEIAKVAAQAGVSGEQFDACLKNQDLARNLNWVKERGRKLGVIGTPNFFVNGKLVKSVIGMAEIRSLVEAASGGRARN
jgi:protein-disulfide isomerase